MDSQIGNVLRKARDRRKVELSEVEDATKIRLRFLRAIESEEWDVLPGGVYTRAFIRTYATFLGLDGERLAEDFRNSVEVAPVERPPEAGPTAPQASRRRLPRRRPVPSAGWLVIGAVIAIAAIAILALPGGGNGGEGQDVSGTPTHHREIQGSRQPAPPRSALGDGVSVRLAANAEVWVCVLDAHGRHLVNGQILEAGAEEGPFHSGSFSVSFGNGEVSMLIDGKQAEIPTTSSPIGYAIDAAGELTELSETERPTCA